MKEAAAKIIGEGMLRGMFGVLDAIVSKAFTYEVDAPETLVTGQLEELLGEFPVALTARIRNDLGAVALLLSGGGAVKLAAAILDSGDAEGDTLSDDAKSALLETAGPALGGGVTNLMERFGRNVEQLEDEAVLDTGTAAEEQIAKLLGKSPSVFPFSYTDGGGLAGRGALLFSASMEKLVPPKELDNARKGPVSEDELNDILSGFGPEPDDDVEEEEARVIAGAPPQNLEMVLDIRLVVTARLGRVDMPIGDILNLGPGSIIEIGQLVDDAIELLINDKLIARGDVVVVDEKFGLRITEIVSRQERIESLR